MRSNLIFAAFLLLAGCASFTDASCVQKIGSVQSVIASTATTTEDLHEAGELSAAQALDIYNGLSAARDASKRAMNLCEADQPGWRDGLEQARGLVSDVRDEYQELSQ